MSSRTCGACGGVFDQSDAWGGPDPCLGLLPGVISACCGHGTGQPYGPYLFFAAGVKLAGREAIECMRGLGGDPPPGDYPPGGVGTGRLSEVSRARALAGPPGPAPAQAAAGREDLQPAAAGANLSPDG